MPKRKSHIFFYISLWINFCSASIYLPDITFGTNKTIYSLSSNILCSELPKYLRLKDLISLHKTNKFFNTIVSHTLKDNDILNQNLLREMMLIADNPNINDTVKNALQSLDLNNFQNINSQELFKLIQESKKSIIEFLTALPFESILITSNNLNEAASFRLFPNYKSQQKDSLELLLSFNNFITLPDMLDQFKSLKILDLSFNKLAHLPSSMSKLPNLEELNLMGNYFENANDIKNFLHLKKLNLSFNYINHVSSVMATNTALESINLSSNMIFIIPGSLINLAFILETIIDTYMVLGNKNFIALIMSTKPNLKIILNKV